MFVSIMLNFHVNIGHHLQLEVNDDLMKSLRTCIYLSRSIKAYTMQDKSIYRVRFWFDGGSLDGRFPRIFAIVQSRNMVVKDAYCNVNGNVGWMIPVNRNLNDWEVGE